MTQRQKSCEAPFLDKPDLRTVGLECERRAVWDGRKESAVDHRAYVNVLAELTPYDVATLDWWGSVPRQRWTLALNVLDRLYQPARWDVCEVNGRPTHCSEIAADLHQQLAEWLVKRVPCWGGSVPVVELRAWVEGQAVDLSRYRRA